MRIELEDTPQAGLVSTAQAVLRCVLGGLLILHGMQKLHFPGAYEVLLGRAGLTEVETLAKCVLALELLAGAGLVLGRFTRTAAFLVVCDVLLGIGLSLRLGELTELASALEGSALTLAASSFFLVVGSGPYGLDHVLRRRARLRAIAKDDLWSRPPYVTHR
jgi:uncharacterized membrane protein YphA (DoxX/SURF4 family)